MKKRMRWALALLCAGLMLAGCNNQNSETTEETTDGFTQLPDYSWDNVNVNDYVKLGQYEGIEYEPMSWEVTEEEVDELVTQLQESTATSAEITEGTVKDGDTVNIDYVGRIDGEAFEGGSAENQTITIGVSSMIPGFVEGLIDQEIGSEIVLDLTFPEDYWNTDYAGKDAEFTIKINYVAGENVLPEVNDEWVKTTTGGMYTTVEDLRTYLRESLEADEEANALGNDQIAVWDQVFAGATVSGYPEGTLDYYNAMQRRQVEEMAAAYGMEYAALVEQMGMTEEEMTADIETAAKDYAANLMVARAILKELDMELTDTEYQTFVEELASSYGYDDLDQLVEDYGGKLAIQDDLVIEKAINYIMDKAVAK